MHAQSAPPTAHFYTRSVEKYPQARGSNLEKGTDLHLSTTHLFQLY